MYQKIDPPKRPHFIFGKRMWEIEVAIIPILGGGIRTEVTFEHIGATLHENGIDMGGLGWTMIETVLISIDGQYNEPKIFIYTRNTGTMVGKDRNGKTIQETEPLGLENYIIQKLMYEAVKIDDKNRDNLKKEELSPRFQEILKKANKDLKDNT